MIEKMLNSKRLVKVLIKNLYMNKNQIQYFALF